MIKSLKDRFQKGLHHQFVPGPFISPSHRELGNKVSVSIADVTEELSLSKSELITHVQERLREQHRERERTRNTSFDLTVKFFCLFFFLCSLSKLRKKEQ